MYQQPPFFHPNPLIFRNKQYVRQYLCLPVVLILGILQIANAVIAIISSLTVTSVSEELFYLFERYLEENPTEVGSVSFSTSISIPVVPIALAIAFLLMHFTAKKNSAKNSDASGATAFWIIAIFQLVGLIISAVIIALAFGILSLYLNNIRYETYYSYGASEYSSSAGEAGIAIAIIVGTFIVLAAVFVVYLIYTISQLMFASSLKKSLTGPGLLAKGAKTYGVMNVIFAVFSCFGVIGSAISFFAVFFAAEDIAHAIGLSSASKGVFILYMGSSVISAGLSFAYYIYMAKFASGYSKHISAAGQGGCNLPMPVMAYNSTPAQPFYQSPASQPAESESAATAEPQTEAVAQEATPAFCSECNATVLPDQSYCANCGAKIV